MHRKSVLCESLRDTLRCDVFPLSSLVAERGGGRAQGCVLGGPLVLSQRNDFLSLTNISSQVSIAISTSNVYVQFLLQSTPWQR